MEAGLLVRVPMLKVASYTSPSGIVIRPLPCLKPPRHSPGITHTHTHTHTTITHWSRPSDQGTTRSARAGEPVPEPVQGFGGRAAIGGRRSGTSDWRPATNWSRKTLRVQGFGGRAAIGGR